MAESKRAQLIAAELRGMDGGYFAFSVDDNSGHTHQLWHKLASADECVEALLDDGYDDIDVYDVVETVVEYSDDERVGVWVWNPVLEEYL
jgi:hypothetical protein